MLRRFFIAIATVAALGISFGATDASAAGHGGGHGGGGHGGGGFHGGGHGGGGFRGGGFRGGGFGGYYGGYGYPYGYGGYYDDYGGCYLVRQRVMTRYGWRLRRVQVCG